MSFVILFVSQLRREELFTKMFTKHFHDYAKKILFINHLSVLK